MPPKSTRGSLGGVGPGNTMTPDKEPPEFSKVVFLLKCHQNPRVLKDMEHRKKEEKYWKKERERERERKRKALRVSSNKNGKSIF
jgi:hypothetical protein